MCEIVWIYCSEIKYSFIIKYLHSNITTPDWLSVGVPDARCHTMISNYSFSYNQSNQIWSDERNKREACHLQSRYELLLHGRGCTEMHFMFNNIPSRQVGHPHNVRVKISYITTKAWLLLLFLHTSEIILHVYKTDIGIHWIIKVKFVRWSHVLSSSMRNVKRFWITYIIILIDGGQDQW